MAKCCQLGHHSNMLSIGYIDIRREGFGYRLGTMAKWYQLGQYGNMLSTGYECSGTSSSGYMWIILTYRQLDYSGNVFKRSKMSGSGHKWVIKQHVVNWINMERCQMGITAVGLVAQLISEST